MRRTSQAYQHLVLSGLIAFVLALMAVPAGAHQDTSFPISSSGNLLDIPEEYGAVVLKVGGRAPTLRVSLRIGDHQIDFPPCIATFFDVPAGEGIRASGSWYHSRSSLPPYLNIQLPQKTRASGYFSGHSLLFNLETAELIHIRQHIADPDGLSMTYDVVEPKDICGWLDRRRLKPLVVETTP